MFENIADKIKATNISSKTIFHDKNWFIGSALQSVDFKDLNKGVYYYSQSTIWTKILKMEKINPYWEIKNDTENFLCVNESYDINAKVLFNILNFYLEYYKFDWNSLIIFGDTHAEKLVENLKENVHFEKLIRPFYIEKKNRRELY